jgi:hypothetical protein
MSYTQTVCHRKKKKKNYIDTQMNKILQSGPNKTGMLMKLQFFWKCSAMSTDKQLLTLQRSTVPPPKGFNLHQQYCENLKFDTDMTYSYSSSLTVASYEDNIIHHICPASEW